MKIQFSKMQGLGNDFVVIDAITQPLSLTVPQIKKMSDRRFGIGFDQLLVIEPAQDRSSDFFLRIFNADGSEVGQCGNGMRCAGRFIIKQGLSHKQNLVLSTISSRVELKLLENGAVTVDMGLPEFSPSKIPFIAKEEALTYSVDVEGQVLNLGVVSLGNPHAVIQVNDLDRTEIAHLGSRLEKHTRFPQRVNVGFMQIINPEQINLRVYERGAGETLACGSGACAAAVIGRRAGLLKDHVRVTQPGGVLSIEWHGNGSPVKMSGPAEFVFDGVLDAQS